MSEQGGVRGRLKVMGGSDDVLFLRLDRDRAYPPLESGSVVIYPADQDPAMALHKLEVELKKLRAAVLQDAMPCRVEAEDE